MCRACEGTTTGLASPAQVVAPEADSPGATVPLRVTQATWSSPVTSRLLIDAGFGTTYYGWGGFERVDNNTRALVRMSEQCAGGCAANGGIAGLGLPVAGLEQQPHRRVSMARGGRLRHRRAQPQGRAHGHLFRGQPRELHERPAARVPREQRRAESAHRSRAVRPAGAGADHGVLRAGTVDARPPHAAGRSPVRPRARVVPGPADRPDALLPQPGELPRDAGRGQLRRRHPARRRGHGRVRQRQDRAEVQHGQIPGGRQHRQPGGLLQHEPGAPAAEHEPAVRTARRAAHLDRCQQQLPSRLQPAEPEPAGPARKRRRLVRTDHEPRLRHGHADELLRSGSHVGIRRAALGLGAERVGAAAAHEARVDRDRLQPPLVWRLHRRGQPGHQGLGLHAVQHHGAARSTAAGRRRVRHPGVVRHRPVAVGPDQQPDHAR